MSLHWWKEVPSWFVVLLSFVICSQLSHGHSRLDVQWIHLLHRGRNFQGQRMLKWVLLGTLGGSGVGDRERRRRSSGEGGLPFGIRISGGSQHSMWKPRSQESQNNMFSYTHTVNIWSLPAHHVYAELSFPPFAFNQSCTWTFRRERTICNRRLK